jgi:thiol-disulfide isomerase/thioredoxin
MVLVALLLAAMPSATVRLQESGSARVGITAPSFGGWDLTGERVLTLEGLRRTPTLAPLLITFCASWCKPCVEGLPRLKAFSRKHPELRLVYIAVEGDPARAQQFAAKAGIDGPAILDKLELIARTYGLAGEQRSQLPRTLLVDAGGKVRAIFGVEGEDLEKAIEADLEAARTPVRPAAEGK